MSGRVPSLSDVKIIDDYFDVNCSLRINRDLDDRVTNVSKNSLVVPSSEDHDIEIMGGSAAVDLESSIDDDRMPGEVFDMDDLPPKIESSSLNASSESSTIPPVSRVFVMRTGQDQVPPVRKHTILELKETNESSPLRS